MTAIFSIAAKPVSPTVILDTGALDGWVFAKVAVNVVLVVPVTVTVSTFALRASINCCVPTPMVVIEAGVTVCVPALVTAVPRVVAAGVSGA